MYEVLITKVVLLVLVRESFERGNLSNVRSYYLFLTHLRRIFCSNLLPLVNVKFGEQCRSNLIMRTLRWLFSLNSLLYCQWLGGYWDLASTSSVAMLRHFLIFGLTRDGASRTRPRSNIIVSSIQSYRYGADLCSWAGKYLIVEYIMDIKLFPLKGQEWY